MRAETELTRDIGYYVVLESEPNASASELARAHHRLVLQWHPDRHPTDDAKARAACTAAMERINEAWFVLGDPVRRAEYDERRSWERAPGQRSGASGVIDRLERAGFSARQTIHDITGSQWLSIAAFPGCDLGVLADLAPDGAWSLRLTYHTIGGAALDPVARLTGLRVLDLGDTGIDDATLARLAPLASLEQLTLWKTAVTDAAVDTLVRFSHLTTLNVSETAITDAGVRRLAALGSLEVLTLRSTQVSARTLERLLPSLPKLRVVGLPHVGPSGWWRLTRRFGHVAFT